MVKSVLLMFKVKTVPIIRLPLDSDTYTVLARWFRLEMDTDPFLIRQKLLRSISPIQLRFSSFLFCTETIVVVVVVVVQNRYLTGSGDMPHLDRIYSVKEGNRKKACWAVITIYFAFDNLFLISIQPYL